MDYKTIFASIVFLSLFLIPLIVFGIDFSSKNSDWRQHWLYSQNGAPSNYPSAVHLFFHPLSFDFNLFFVAGLFLVIVLPCLLIWLLFKNWIYIAFFFMLSNSYWIFVSGGHLTQAIIGVLLLCLLYFKKWWQWIIIAVISYFVHTNGFYLVTGAALALLFFEFLKNIENAQIYRISGLCGGGGLIKDYQSFFVNLQGKSLLKTSILEFANFFVKICPLPIFLAGLNGLWDESKAFLITGCFFLLYNALFQGSVRVLESLALFFLIGFFYWYSKSKAEWKPYFIPLALFVFAINYYNYIQYLLMWKWC